MSSDRPNEHINEYPVEEIPVSSPLRIIPFPVKRIAMRILLPVLVLLGPMQRSARRWPYEEAAALWE